MANITPLKVIGTGGWDSNGDVQGDTTSLGEFEAGDYIPVEHGGTGAATAAAARSALGAQTQSTILDGVVGLGAATGLVEKTGASTFDTVTVTAFAKTLLDDIDAPTARATLGITSAIDAGTFTHLQRNYGALSGTSVTIDLALSGTVAKENLARHESSANVTYTFINPTLGQVLNLTLRNSAAAATTFALPANTMMQNDESRTLSLPAGETWEVSAYYKHDNAGTPRWFANIGKRYVLKP